MVSYFPTQTRQIANFVSFCIAIRHASQMRPRSRTLKAVHAAILDDIVTPAGITGRSTRITVNEGRRERVFVDPLDKEAVDAKLEAFSHAYAKLTTHKIHFEYSKPTAFQKTKLDKKSSRK